MENVSPQETLTSKSNHEPTALMFLSDLKVYYMSKSSTMTWSRFGTSNFSRTLSPRSQFSEVWSTSESPTHISSSNSHIPFRFIPSKQPTKSQQKKTLTLKRQEKFHLGLLFTGGLAPLTTKTIPLKPEPRSTFPTTQVVEVVDGFTQQTKGAKWSRSGFIGLGCSWLWTIGWSTSRRESVKQKLFEQWNHQVEDVSTNFTPESLFCLLPFFF